MVDFTTDDLRKILEINRYEPNILEYYDNVTYNIRFYMMNHAFQKRLSQDRLDGKFFNGEFKIPDRDKIIIAETGVSEHYSITSLQISSVHASAERNPSAATYKLEMRMHEVDGCDLVNKITAVSKAVGYENYVCQPFHIDIWFSGYEQATGKPIQIIENMVFTYEVLLGEVKTQVDNNGCEYNFIMTPVPQSGMDKYITNLFQIGEIRPDTEGRTGGTSYGSYVTRMVELINEKFVEDNPAIKQYYLGGPENGYLVIDNYITGNAVSYEAMVHEATKKYKAEQEYNDYVKKAKSYATNPNQLLLSNQSMNPAYMEEQNYTPYVPNISIDTINKKDFENSPISDFIASQSSDKVAQGYMQFESGTSFEQALQELCFHSEDLNTYVVRPRYRVEYIENDGGIECRRIHCDLVFTDNSYLHYFKDRAIEQSYNQEQEDLRIKNMQLNEARNLILNNLLRKRYEWLYNGIDTAVLEFNSSIDKLWYANVGLENVLTVNKASSDVVKQVNQQEQFKKLVSAYESTILDPKKNIATALQESNKPLEGVRGLASDKRLYLDDIYRCLSEDTKTNYLTKRNIYEKNDKLSDADTNNIDDLDTKTSIMTKAGYNNIHAAGNLVEVELTILGDPFWLGICEDKNLYNGNNISNDFDKFFHFAFGVKYGLPENEDGTYALEDVTEFSNIYQIVESTSILESGKFIQKIKGVLDPAFMHLARIEGL